MIGMTIERVLAGAKEQSHRMALQRMSKASIEDLNLQLRRIEAVLPMTSEAVLEAIGWSLIFAHMDGWGDGFDRAAAKLKEAMGVA